MQDKSARAQTINNEKFVRLWMECGTYPELVEKTGLTIKGCYNRASELRRAGVELPQMIVPGRSRINAAALNKIIKKGGARKRPLDIWNKVDGK